MPRCSGRPRVDSAQNRCACNRGMRTIRVNFTRIVLVPLVGEVSYAHIEGEKDPWIDKFGGTHGRANFLKIVTVSGFDGGSCDQPKSELLTQNYI